MDSKQENYNEQLNNLSEIRSMMERSSSFISLSGLSGISAGVIGLITSYILDYKIGPYAGRDTTIFLTTENRKELILFCAGLCIACLTVTFIAAWFFTSRRAKKKGLSVWDASAKRLALNLFIPLAAGGLFCLILIYHYF